MVANASLRCGRELVKAVGQVGARHAESFPRLQHDARQGRSGGKGMHPAGWKVLEGVSGPGIQHQPILHSIFCDCEETCTPPFTERIKRGQGDEASRSAERLQKANSLGKRSEDLDGRRQVHTGLGRPSMIKRAIEESPSLGVHEGLRMKGRLCRQLNTGGRDRHGCNERLSRELPNRSD